MIWAYTVAFIPGAAAAYGAAMTVDGSGQDGKRKMKFRAAVAGLAVYGVSAQLLAAWWG